MLHLTDLFKDITTELGIMKDINNFQAVRDLISHWINTRFFIAFLERIKSIYL